jgi:hypothetical protein
MAARNLAFFKEMPRGNASLTTKLEATGNKARSPGSRNTHGIKGRFGETRTTGAY